MLFRSTASLALLEWTLREVIQIPARILDEDFTAQLDRDTRGRMHAPVSGFYGATP
jgi:hypothetical protein